MTNSNASKNWDEYLISSLDSLTKIIAWFKIMLSPFLIGILFGGLVYYLMYPDKMAWILSIAITLVGLVIGILWANKHWKNKSTVWFMSRTMASPELNKEEKENPSSQE